MPDALQVMAQGVRFRSGAHDQHIARAHPAVVAVIEQSAIHEPAQAEENATNPTVISTMLRGMSLACVT